MLQAFFGAELDATRAHPETQAQTKEWAKVLTWGFFANAIVELKAFAYEDANYRAADWMSRTRNVEPPSGSGLRNTATSNGSPMADGDDVFDDCHLPKNAAKEVAWAVAAF